MVDGATGMLADARRAVEAEPPGSPWHPLASLLLGVAHVLAGDRATAVKELERAEFLGGPRQYPGILVALSELSALAADRGDWTAADGYATRALEMLREGHLQNYRPAMIAYAVAARAAAQDGRREEAVVHAGNAVRLYGGESAPVVLPWLLVRTDLVLGRTFLALDDPGTARQHARDARRHLAPLRDSGVLGDQVAGLVADVERGGGPTAGTGTATLTEAELRVLQLMPTHLSAAEIGAELQITRNTVKFHVAAIYRKLGATTRAAAVRAAQELGLLSG
jgi:LuxR family maltose regulon positive regulatory protein